MMKKSDQDRLALKLKASIKEFLYCKSPLRNEFQVRCVDQNEVKTFENVEYARYIKADGVQTDIVKNKNVWVPFFNLSCMHQDFENFDDKYEGFYKIFCTDMLTQEEMIFKSLKKYYTKNRKGILLIRTDIQILSANEKEGFYAFEQIGVIVLNKN